MATMIDPQTGLPVQIPTAGGTNATINPATGQVTVGSAVPSLGGLPPTGVPQAANIAPQQTFVPAQQQPAIQPGFQTTGPTADTPFGGPTFVTGGQNRTRGFQAVDPLTGAPPTGLLGAENALLSSADKTLDVLRAARSTGISALQGGAGQATGEIGTGREAATQFLQQAIGGFDPLAQEGTQASAIQSALSGALGPDAQRQALANLQPVNEFLQEQGQRAVTRNASALGGLGGGNVLRELTRFGQGLAGQSAQQQFSNLGTVAGRGFGALQNIGDLRGQQANVQSLAGRDIANILSRTGEAELGARLTTGSRLGDVLGGTGQQLAQGRSLAGQQIAGQIGGTSSALANLINQQGTGLSELTGVTGGNLANILASAGQQQAGQQQDLATILANIATQSATGPQTSAAQFINTQGTGQAAGTALSALGGLLAAFSDERLKTNVVKIGQTPAGANLYQWDWTEEAKQLVNNQPSVGVMAQELQQTQPDAVSVGADGFLRVNYLKVA